MTTDDRYGCGVLSLRHSVVLPAVRATEPSPPRHPSACRDVNRAWQFINRS